MKVFARSVALGSAQSGLLARCLYAPVAASIAVIRCKIER